MCVLLDFCVCPSGFSGLACAIQARSNSSVKDNIYQQTQRHLVDFAFDQRVVNVFPDMIRRSVPGYELVVPLSGLMAARHIRAGDRVYDLGCSLGATTLALLSQLGNKSCEVIAVDQSASMLARARELVTDERVQFIEADVTTLDFMPARVVLSNWLLQFVDPQQRLPLLTTIARSLQGGGQLLLAEKIRFDDPATQSFMEDTHHAFKTANGYSDLEISQKRSALENVMVVDTETSHLERLHAAGFSKVTVWYRCLNWISFLAQA